MGRFYPFATPSTNDRYLREGDGWSRRKPPLRRACVIRCLPGVPHRQRVMSPRVCDAEKRGQHWRWRHRRERHALVKDTSDALSQRRLKGPELTLRSF
jgi:hypothetical protein